MTTPAEREDLLRKAGFNVFLLAARDVLIDLLTDSGTGAMSNGHFDTTRASVEHSGAAAIDLPCEEGLNIRSEAPFKGDIDLSRLHWEIERIGPGNVPCVVMTVTNNSRGGQPVSLANLRQVRAICDEFSVPLVLDVC